jgi:hypothetical protein
MCHRHPLPLEFLTWQRPQRHLYSLKAINPIPIDSNVRKRGGIIYVRTVYIQIVNIWKTLVNGMPHGHRGAHEQQIDFFSGNQIQECKENFADDVYNHG